MIYWFIGQPGSGKTLLADKLKEEVLPHAYRIDGDEMRELFDNKDYSMKGRIANIDAAQKIAHYLHNQGKDVIVSLVSPYRDQREKFKELIGEDLQEIYVYATEDRPRAEYKVADYQPPTENYISFDTTGRNADDNIQLLMKEL